MNIKQFTATKAFIFHNKKVLILKESTKYQDGANAGKFDVPGGRVNPGQRFDESLKREIKKETGLEITIVKPFFVNEWRPVVKNEQWQIVGIYFECSTDSNKVKLSEDHDEYQWINPQDYQKYDLIENLTTVFENYSK